LLYSPAELIVHDNGGEFVNSLLLEIHKLLDVQVCRVTAFRPSGNGVVERCHAVIHKLLATSVAENQRNWTDCLPYITYAYNTSHYNSRPTTFTPFYLMFLREPQIGLDLVTDGDVISTSNKPEAYVLLLRERMQAAYGLVHKQLQAVFQRAKRRYDVRVKLCQFNVGDLVWFYSPRSRRHVTHKWTLKTSGPYRVERQISDVNYVIRSSSRHRAFTVHVDRLRHYRPPMSHSLGSPVSSRPRPLARVEEEGVVTRPRRAPNPPRRFADE